ncbi:hypothetical protein HD806DRAFT_481695 [Xylariaceae sp. AK1471]|nr:hypothetical protein HD806DRAFT_481695 [Xylariaceae sp. AK1471]
MTETTNLGPLTTPFVLIPNCSEAMAYDFKYWTNSPSYYLLQGPIVAISCFPSGYDGGRSQYYSPGVCPQDYTPACSSRRNVGPSTETVYTCCPTKYDYECLTSPVYPWYPWYETLGCTVSITSGIFSTHTSLIEVSGESTYVTDSVANFAGGINAYGVQVAFKSTDFITTTTTRQLTTSSTTQTVTQTLTLPSQTATTACNSKPVGLSPGAAAGIGVTSGVSVIALISSVIFFLLGRRERNQSTGAQEASMSGAIVTHSANNSDGQGQLSATPEQAPMSEEQTVPVESKISHYA